MGNGVEDLMGLPETGKRVVGRESMGYVAKSSKDYVNQFQALKKHAQAGTITREDQIRHFANTVLDKTGSGINIDGWKKVGQQFVGPILIRLRYEGIVRDMLVERPLAQGVVPVYPCKRDIGVAYVVSGQFGEVRIHRVEAERIYVQLFRVASRPMVSKSDVYAFDFDLIASIKDDATLMIKEEEDKKYLGLLNASISAFYTRTGVSHVVDVVGGTWVPSALHTGARLIANQRLKGEKIIMNAGEYYDLYSWGTDQIGWKMRDQITDVGVFARYGELDIKPTIACPEGTAYVQPAPEYVGFMPVRWSLESTPLDEPENGLMGFVFDELIGMIIVNHNGLIRLSKS